jgi:hypothetical protein
MPSECRVLSPPNAAFLVLLSTTESVVPGRPPMANWDSLGGAGRGAARAAGVGVATAGGYRVRRQRGPVAAPLRRASPPCEAGRGCTTVVSARDRATVHAVLSTAWGCSAGLSRASTARGAPWRQIASRSTFAAHG